MCKQGCCDGARTPTTEELLKVVNACDCDIDFQDGVLMGLWLAGRDDVHFAVMSTRRFANLMLAIHTDLADIVDALPESEAGNVPGLRERLAEAEQWANGPEARK